MKKSILILLSVLMVLCVACAGGEATPTENTTPSTTAPEETAAPFDLAGYQALVSSCVVKMEIISDLYIVMANYEAAVWEAHNQLNSVVTADKLVQEAWAAAGKSDISKTKVEQEQDAIMQMYKEIISTEVDGGEGKALREVFNQYFDAYLALLNLVNAPVSEYDTFVQNRDDYSKTLDTCETKLEALLP